ncbi:MAG TPA: DUF4188 domain-containing protein [Thermomicrobiales bacterium]|nr:DUF4188 domain-containing protein [Thermomicrobiales bacterium]
MSANQTDTRTGEPAIIRGRFVANPPPGTVVFLFGIRINSWSQIRHWLPVVRSLRRMIREQEARPDSGLLWSTRWRDGREITVLQYWRDMDALMGYAQDKSFTHAGAWKTFNHGVGDSGIIGLWHEAYTIDAESPRGLHTIYRDIPERGLAAATERVDAEQHALRRFARERG